MTTNLNSAARERYIQEKQFILSSKFLKLSTFKGKCILYTYFRVLHILQYFSRFTFFDSLALLKVMIFSNKINLPVDNLDHSILVIITDPILTKGP